ncbi:MAG: TlpA disulfide reductase family protein [Bacteroidota bacterium]|nr:TlpA disulfide reductase family protein [Bacteroidota bacterium]
MNYHRIALFALFYLFSSQFAHSQTVKSIIKQIEKTQKFYKAYELKYDSYFKFFDYNDTSFYHVHQFGKHSLKQLDLGWELKTNSKDTMLQVYDASQIVIKSNFSNQYFIRSIKESLNAFVNRKRQLTYLPLRYGLNPKEFVLLEENENYYVLMEEESSKDESLDIFSTMKLLLHVNKKTFFIDTFQQWFWMTGQVQYQKLVLKSIQSLPKDKIKKLQIEVDSLKSHLKTYVNGDSLYKANHKDDKKLLEKGDSVPNFKAHIFGSTDSIVFSVPKDSIVIVDFFYTSCGPCIAAIPHLKEIDSLYRPKGIAVMGINPMKSDYPRLEKFVKYHQITYPIVLIEYDVASKMFGVSGYPTLFIIKNNQVVFIQVGFSKDLMSTLTKELNKLLNN